MLAFFSSTLQALTAIVLVSVLAIVLRYTRAELMDNVRWLEAMSFGLIALLGVLLVFKAARKLHTLYITRVQQHAHKLDHHHHHDDDHNHDHNCGCGHTHMPDAGQARAVKDLRGFLMAALSVGLRPCTGALVVLVFALSQKLYWAGVLATLFMGLGTAITVSLIASGAVGARGLTKRLFLGRYPVSSLYAGALVQGLAGGFLAFVGLGLMAALLRAA
jgi:ABC-type nickel/cobalt efflux system permease component RcnA